MSCQSAPGYDHKALFWSRHSRLQCARSCGECQGVVRHIVIGFFVAFLSLGKDTGAP
ncbi:unnamed protein product [Staurois parvus]|uniref:Uncharacterized protein n=1 Tax=Staurois parvus TaxID=386267 RepID=A0ABN9FSQ5_9NEOB|nr:unnamed protein product [Staurois parvus]